MAFNFPDTNDLDNGHTVENTQRGVFYSWDGSRGKWIVSGTTREGGGATTTRELLLANPTRLGGARTLPPVPDGLTTQEDYNRWLYDTLEKIDLWVGDDPPADPLVGQLWFSTNPEELTLYVYDGAVWVPASPPVSLDGIENSIASIDEELMTINRNIAINKCEIDESVLDIQDDQKRQNEAIEYNSRECTQLRSRIGDVEMSQSTQDGRLDKLEIEEDKTNARLFGSPYVFRQDKKAADLASGEFTYDSDWNWYAQRYDAAGDRIGVSSDNTFTTDGMFKVYKHNGAINLICIMHRYESCKCGQEGNDYMKWKRKASIYTHLDWLEDGETYYLSDGFLLPQ
jgi:hypothetical protein